MNPVGEIHHLPRQLIRKSDDSASADGMQLLWECGFLEKARKMWHSFEQLKVLAFLGDAQAISAHRQQSWSQRRRCASKIISSNLLGALMTIVIIANMIFVFVQANLRAKCESRSDSCPNPLFKVLNCICLVMYVSELLLRLYVQRDRFCSCPLNAMDAIVVAISIIGELCDNLMQHATVLRLIRALRFTRILGLLSMFRELYLMLACLVSTMRTIFWACLMLSVFLLVLALVGLEVLKPIHKEIIQERKALGISTNSCHHSETAFDSIGESMATLFGAIVIGDGFWDTLVLLMEKDWRATIAVSSSFALIYLVVNGVILSVIVARACEAYHHDDTYKATSHRRVYQRARQELMVLLQEVAANTGNTISLTDLKVLWVSSATFHDYFTAMNVDMSFLEHALALMDSDSDGEVTFDDFADSVVRLKNTDAGPVAAFIQHQVTQVMNELTDLKTQVSSFQKEMAESALMLNSMGPVTVVVKC